MNFGDTQPELEQQPNRLPDSPVIPRAGTGLTHEVPLPPAALRPALTRHNAQAIGHIIRQASNEVSAEQPDRPSSDTKQNVLRSILDSSLEVSEGQKPSTTEKLPQPQTHTIARTEINPKLRLLARIDRGIDNLTRAPVDDHEVAWDVPAPHYSPPYIDIPRGSSSVRKAGDQPDPADPSKIAAFTSITTTEVRRDEAGRPLNPIGRTGLAGRGMLDKWGETQAADLILSRHNPVTGLMEVAAIQREDTGEWALPGGKVDPGEAPIQTAKREFQEEAGGSGIELDLSDAELVYAGYVDDSRNTDNAWMATTCFHKHLTSSEARAIELVASSDATEARWAPVDAPFFEGHGRIIRAILHPRQQ